MSRPQEHIELWGKLTSENKAIWEEEAKDAANGNYTLLIVKVPKPINPNQLEALFKLLKSSRIKNI